MLHVGITDGPHRHRSRVWIHPWRILPLTWIVFTEGVRPARCSPDASAMIPEAVHLGSPHVVGLSTLGGFLSAIAFQAVGMMRFRRYERLEHAFMPMRPCMEYSYPGYSDSKKSGRNGAALLDKPAVAPTNESVITIENCYMASERTYRTSNWQNQLPSENRKALRYSEIRECNNLYGAWLNEAGVRQSEGKQPIAVQENTEQYGPGL